MGRALALILSLLGIVVSGAAAKKTPVPNAPHVHKNQTELDLFFLDEFPAFSSYSDAVCNDGSPGEHGNLPDKDTQGHLPSGCPPVALSFAMLICSANRYMGRLQTGPNTQISLS